MSLLTKNDGGSTPGIGAMAIAGREGDRSDEPPGSRHDDIETWATDGPPATPPSSMRATVMGAVDIRAGSDDSGDSGSTAAAIEQAVA